MKCLICNKDFKQIDKHLNGRHNMSYEYYYFNYLKGHINKCKICGKNAVFVRNLYKDYCSKKCMYTLIQKKVKETNIKRYGVACSLNTKESMAKKKNTWLKKYGVDNPSKVNTIKEQKKKTCMEHYGVDSLLRLKFVRDLGKDLAYSEESKEKKRNTCIKKYGVSHHLKNNEILKKQQDTNIKKYDNTCSLHGEKVKEKVKNTWLEKYGVDNPSKNLDIINKLRNKATEREAINRKKIMIPKLKELLIKNNLILLNTYIGAKKDINVKCMTCNKLFKTTYHKLYCNGGKCSVCYKFNSSNDERDLCEFIESLGFVIERNNRKIIKPKELDIYIPDKKLAIEYNGLYWHSEQKNSDKNYHLKKLNECKSKGITLIQIFEDEWIFRNDIVKNTLKHILNVNINKRLHARKCIIKLINNDTKNLFLDKYHIQGQDISSIRLGAFYENELVAVMTFSKGSISKGSSLLEGNWELSRFCINYNYRIPGIASKFLSFFKNNYKWKEIYSYADMRWGTGNVYKILGFNQEHINRPNYWYIKDRLRIHRYRLRKKELEPKDIPEWLLRLNEGYSRIWDCGTIKFSMKNI